MEVSLDRRRHLRYFVTLSLRISRAQPLAII